MNTSTPYGAAPQIIDELLASARRDFAQEQADATRVLQDLIRTATRELAQHQAGALVSIDWIEQDANRYHDHLTKMAGLSRQMSALAYAHDLLTPAAATCCKCGAHDNLRETAHADSICVDVATCEARS